MSARDRGSATAELAVVLPGLILVTAVCVWAVASVAVHVRCLDAARTGARGLARDETVTQVLTAVRERAPGGAQVRVRRLGGGLVEVEVAARVSLPGPWPGDGPAVTVGGTVVAAEEGRPP